MVLGIRIPPEIAAMVGERAPSITSAVDALLIVASYGTRAGQCERRATGTRTALFCFAQQLFA